MKQKIKSISLLTAMIISAIGMSVTSCGDSNSWTVKGTVNGVPDSTILVEASDNGRWYTLDTIKTSGSGAFKYSHKASGYPDIYRLRLGNRTLYFPVDSIETVIVTTDSVTFDTGYTLSGTPIAENMMNIDRKIMDAVAKGEVIDNETLKKELTQMLLADPSGIVSYYIINKKIDGKPLFNPADKKDNKVIGAVANAYTIMRPGDPRTTYLKRLYLANRPRYEAEGEPGDTLVAREVRAFEINLYDNRGVQHSLIDELDKGNVVVLNFTAYSADESPAFNIALNKVYEKYHNSGLEIFQVSIDNDEYTWKSAAANLPWITVLNSVADETSLLNYNVQAIPTTYIFNRKGELVERVDDITTLDSVVAKYM